MGFNSFKNEFLHPQTPEYVQNTFYEIVCLKDSNKGLTE